MNEGKAKEGVTRWYLGLHSSVTNLNIVAAGPYHESAGRQKISVGRRGLVRPSEQFFLKIFEGIAAAQSISAIVSLDGGEGQRVDAEPGVNALLFLYDAVLNKKFGPIDGVVRAKRPQRLPVVLTKEEVKKVIDHMTGLPRLMAILLLRWWFATDGMLSSAGQRYRFFTQRDITRAGKSDNDRHTLLPAAIRSLFPDISRRIDPDINKTSGRDLVASHCRMLWIANTQTRVENGHGSGFFRLLNTTRIGLRAKNAVIIYTSRSYNEPFATLS